MINRPQRYKKYFIYANENTKIFAYLKKLLYLCSRFAAEKQAERRKVQQMNEFLETEEAILKMLKTVFDPEIPVNVYDLGLIYGIDIKEDGTCDITMTLTAPSCPAGDFLVEDIRQKVGSVEGIKDVNVNIVFEPEWNKDMMSEEAKLELGFL